MCLSFFFSICKAVFTFSKKMSTIDHWRKQTYDFYPVRSCFKLLSCIECKRKMYLGYCPKQTYSPFNLSPFKAVAKTMLALDKIAFFLISYNLYKNYCLNFLFCFHLKHFACLYSSVWGFFFF